MGSMRLELTARNPSQLGNALARFRKKTPSTQTQLGLRAGLKQAVISTAESGAAGTRLETIFKILAALDLELVIRKRRKSN